MLSIRNILLLLFFTAIASGCTDILAFDLTTELDEITVPGDELAHQNHIAIDMSKIDNTGFQVKLSGVQGALDLLAMRLYVTETALSGPNDRDNFDFLQSLTITIVPLNNSTLQPMVLGTWDGPGPAGIEELELTVESPPNLTEYISSGARFEVNLTGIVPSDEISIGGDITFLVNPV